MDIRRLQEPRHAEARKARQSRSSTAPKSIPTTHCGFTLHPPLPMLCLPLSNSNKQHTKGMKFWQTNFFLIQIPDLETRLRISELFAEFLSDPSPIITLPCQSMLSLFCSNVGFVKPVTWISLSCFMDVKIYTWIFFSCYMDFFKLLHGFLKIDLWISLICYMDL